MTVLKYHIDHPLLADTLSAVPDTEAEYYYSCNPLDGPPVSIVSLTAPDEAELEAALAGDSTVDNPQLLQRDGDVRLYKVEPTLPDEGAYVRTKMAELGGVLQSARGTGDGWEVVVEFPDRTAVNQYYQHCEDVDLDVEILELYSDDERSGATKLTESQREVLQTAIDAGYFEIPRESSLTELASSLNVSPNAASESLRRGLRNLVQSRVITEDS